jgi:hypothetical protein
MPVELKKQEAIRGEASGSGVDQTQVVRAPVAGGEDGAERFACELRMIRRRRRRNVGEVGNDGVEPSRHRIQQVALAHADAAGESMAAHVGASEHDRASADIGRPHFGRRAFHRYRDGDRSAAAADIDDAAGAIADLPVSCVDELFSRRSRRHYPTRKIEQLQPVE